MKAWPKLQAYWLKVTAKTGSLPKRQTCEPMRSEQAAVRYMVAHATKKNQQAFTGRRWHVINPKRIEERSAAHRPWTGEELPGLWPAWFDACRRSVPFSPDLWLHCTAGWVPRWNVGTPPDRAGCVDRAVATVLFVKNGLLLTRVPFAKEPGPGSLPPGRARRRGRRRSSGTVSCAGPGM